MNWWVVIGVAWVVAAAVTALMLARVIRERDKHDV